MSAYIHHLGTAVPKHRFAQSEILSFMIQAHGLNEADAHSLAVLYRAGGIGHRHSVLPDFGQAEGGDFFVPKGSKKKQPDTRERMYYYAQESLNLALAAIHNGGIKFSEITHLVWVSCTGMQAPGSEIALLEHYHMQEGVSRFALQFMGCYAALPGLRLAQSIAESQPGAKVLVICLELCTLHFQHEPSPDNLLANSLFADGAAAMLISGKARPDSWELRKSFSALVPEGRDDMAWNIGPFGFEMRLSAAVPGLLRSHFPQLKDRLMEQLSTEEPCLWAIHPGGKAILEGIADAMGLLKTDYRDSLATLRQYGNMSSATLPFVLQKIWSQKYAQDQDLTCLAFGPGLSIEALSLRYHA
jgi:predicted naringenin-chalcone synthase